MRYISEDFMQSASFGPEGADSPYRYGLTRRLNDVPLADAKRVAFVMLNPSTATHTETDPTIRRCIGYAKTWGFDVLEVGNIFALRSTDPKALYSHEDPIGPYNDMFLRGMSRRAALTICAWGVHGAYMGRGSDVKAMLAESGTAASVLRLTKGGAPGHPLYLPADLVPSLWVTA